MSTLIKTAIDERVKQLTRQMRNGTNPFIREIIQKEIEQLKADYEKLKK